MIRAVSPSEQLPVQIGGSQQWPSFVTDLQQRIEQWVRSNPVGSLAVAASVGAVLGWAIKRRPRG